MTFDSIETECDQELDLIQDPMGLIAYPLK